MNNVMEISEKIWKSLKEIDSDTLMDLVHSNAVFVHMGVTLSRDEEINIIKSREIIY